jgi:hypothetical protein
MPLAHAFDAARVRGNWCGSHQACASLTGIACEVKRGSHKSAKRCQTQVARAGRSATNGQLSRTNAHTARYPPAPGLPVNPHQPGAAERPGWRRFPTWMCRITPDKSCSIANAPGNGSMRVSSVGTAMQRTPAALAEATPRGESSMATHCSARALSVRSAAR